MSPSGQADVPASVAAPDPQLPTYLKPTVLPGLLQIERPTFGDERGFFREIERRDDLEQVIGRTVRHAQWNHSRSSKGVLRGIQVAAWSKCIYVVRGSAQVVIVDARAELPTFGQFVSLVLGERNRAALWLPPGLGNSFLVLSPLVDFMYSVDAAWYPEGEYGIAWNDPDLAIPWRNPAPQLSERDQQNPTLRERFPARFAAPR